MSQRPGQPLPSCIVPLAHCPSGLQAALHPHLQPHHTRHQDLQILGSVSLSVSKVLLVGGGLAGELGRRAWNALQKRLQEPGPVLKSVMSRGFVILEKMTHSEKP